VIALDWTMGVRERKRENAREDLRYRQSEVPTEGKRI